tara:strand:+ start:655 stop:1527 length:873 start_codon:yes stop_codon:yes gene_type:complete
MNNIKIYEHPNVEFTNLIFAFSGWSDANGTATKAVQFLIEKTKAKKFAEIHAENFYDFSIVRPNMKFDKSNNRILEWPKNEFYYSTDESTKGLMFFLGVEPNLKWKTFSSSISTFCSDFKIKMMISLGALLDSVPHTRPIKISGRFSNQHLKDRMEWLGVKDSQYEGPTGINTVLMQESIEKNGQHISLWGHTPHYVTSSTNPNVTLALLNRVMHLAEFELDVQQFIDEGNRFVDRVNGAIEIQGEIKSYVQKLEQAYDLDFRTTTDIPSSETMIEELEKFLNNQMPKNE